MLAAGTLDKRVTIEAPTSTRNAIGEAVPGWSVFAAAWASIEPLQGREFWAQQQVQSEVTVRIRIRYLAGVTAAMRVVGGPKVYTILAVINPGDANEELQLMCSEGVSNG